MNKFSNFTPEELHLLSLAIGRLDMTYLEDHQVVRDALKAELDKQEVAHLMRLFNNG